MPHGIQRRRIAPVVAPIVGMLALSAGCQRPMVQGLDSVPTPQAAAHVPPKAVASAAKPVVPAETELFRTSQPPRPATPTAPAPPTAVSLPTPTLDALANRSQALRQAAVESLAVPETKPPAATPPPASPSAPAPPAKDPEPPPSIDLPLLGKTATNSDAPLIDPDRTVTPRRPRHQWRDGLEQLRILAHDQAVRTDEADGDWAVRSILLDWMAESHDDDSARFWHAVLTALTASSASGPTDDRARSEAIRLAVDALEDHAPLEITDLRLCRKVNGFGNYELVEGAACKSGRPVIIYCEMTGLRYEPAGDAYRSRLASQAEILPLKGEKPLWVHPLGTAEDHCSRRRRDYYVNYRIQIPQRLAPGAYTLRLKQRDLATERTAVRSLTLTIRP